MKFSVDRQTLCSAAILLLAICCEAADRELSGFCWTDWVNFYRANEGKDLEIVTRIAALQYGLCLRPVAVDYARVDGRPVKEKLRCNFYGCSCRDVEQEPGVFCSDYKVRFLCKCEHKKHSENPTNDLFLCPNESPMALKCEGQAIIKIKTAYYGNIWISRCGLGSIATNCREDSFQTLADAALQCNGREACMLQLPTSNASRVGCNTKDYAFHIEYACEAIALAPGNYMGKIGEIYVDPTCKYKCVFLLSNRAICLPVCPIFYGFACPTGSVIRWKMVPDAFAKHCSCRKPVCLDIKMRCKVNGKVYSRGQRFQLGCKEECICLGKNELKCIPLCRTSECPSNAKITYTLQPTKYRECNCIVVKCRYKLREIPGGK